MVVVTTGTTAWLTFRDLEKALDIHGNTLRRWNELFPTFLGGKKIDRVMSFPKDSLETFRLIKILYDEGKQTADVIATLAKEMAQTLEVQPIQQGENPSPPSPRQAPGTGLDLQLAPLVNVLDRLASSLETMAMNQQKFLEGVERRLMALEASKMPQEGPKEIKRGNVHNQPTEAQEGPDMTREEKIRLVHELHASGKGGRATASELNRRGVRTLSGNGRWGSGTVKRILKGGAGHGE